MDDRKKTSKEKYRKVNLLRLLMGNKTIHRSTRERELITHQAGHRKYYSKSITQKALLKKYYSKSITQNALHKKQNTKSPKVNDKLVEIF